MKLAWANTARLSDAKFVVVGVPYEGGIQDILAGKDLRGTKKAPDYIRKVSHSCEEFRYGKTKSVAQAECSKISARIMDSGNIAYKNIAPTITKILQHQKIPIVLGGDHSITSEILKSFSSHTKAGKISLLYFDSHPDFVCSHGNFHGSVLCTVPSLKNISLKNSCLVGIRQPEQEELDNMNVYGLHVVPAYAFADGNLTKIKKKIQKVLGKNKIYISIDLDVVDPAFAPGVSTPVAGGLSSNQLLEMVRSFAGKQLVGLDIVELNPKKDRGNMTADLACRIMAQVFATL